MKIKQISNENFCAGKIYNSTNNKQITKLISNIKPKIEKEKFDIYITQKDSSRDFYEIKVKNPYNSQTHKPVYIHKNVLQSTLYDAIKNAIELFN